MSTVGLGHLMMFPMHQCYMKTIDVVQQCSSERESVTYQETVPVGRNSVVVQGLLTHKQKFTSNYQLIEIIYKKRSDHIYPMPLHCKFRNGLGTECKNDRHNPFTWYHHVRNIYRHIWNNRTDFRHHAWVRSVFSVFGIAQHHLRYGQQQNSSEQPWPWSSGAF